jgi:hypothetical protein
MTMARAAKLVLWAALTVGTGCAGTPRYLRDRGADFADIVQFHAVASLGADAKLEVTRFVGVGGGAYDGYAVGFANRRLGAWHERVYDFGVPRFGMNLHAERLEGTMPSVSGDYDICLRGSRSEYAHDSQVPLDWMTLRLTAVVFVGADFELRLGQAVDFVAGVFGHDLSLDDRPA